jgi:hypothetical protein
MFKFYECWSKTLDFQLIWYTVKFVYNDHPRDPKFVAVVDRWSLFKGRFMLKRFKLGLKNNGRYRQVVVIRRWSLAQVWLYVNRKYNRFPLWDVLSWKSPQEISKAHFCFVVFNHLFNKYKESQLRKWLPIFKNLAHCSYVFFFHVMWL